MCIDILRNPVAAVAKAKKKNTNKTWLALAEASLLFAISAMVLILKGTGFDQTSLIAAVTSGASIFVTILVVSAILGFVLKIIVTTLGGKGQYYEGLTVVAYSLLPISASLLAAAVLSLVPAGVVLSSIAIAVGFASGMSLLYRAIKELFSTDMVTALVAVSILIIVIFVAASVSVGLSTLANIGNIVPIA